MALAEQDHHLPDLLAAFHASDEAEEPTGSWLLSTYGDQLRPSYVEKRTRAAFERARTILYPTSDPRAAQRVTPYRHPHRGGKSPFPPC